MLPSIALLNSATAEFILSAQVIYLTFFSSRLTCILFLALHQSCRARIKDMVCDATFLYESECIFLTINKTGQNTVSAVQAHWSRWVYTSELTLAARGRSGEQEQHPALLSPAMKGRHSCFYCPLSTRWSVVGILESCGWCLITPWESDLSLSGGKTRATHGAVGRHGVRVCVCVCFPTHGATYLTRGRSQRVRVLRIHNGHLAFNS